MTIDLPPATTLERRRTRIVATVGPASRDPDLIIEMIKAGVNVFRLNMSHGGYEGHCESVQTIRAAEEKLDVPVAIMADLCGPKIRVGEFENGKIDLKRGEQVTITTRDIKGKPGLIPCQYVGLCGDVSPNDRILMNDGLLELRVDQVQDTEILCTVVEGGPLSNRKGINLPGVTISAPTLTDKDRQDARFALEQGVDFLALSFVRTADDIRELLSLIADQGHSVPVIAKIEKPEALSNISEILDVSDGIMVARGDLGVEISPERVPFIQDELVIHARRKGKPVIVATQMLESMVTNPTPTRAEVSDVSHAVFTVADAVMLSAETSVGEYPLKAVQMMDRVARQVEGWLLERGGFPSLPEQHSNEKHHFPLRYAVARSMSLLSNDLDAKAVVVRTKSGTTAGVMASIRPEAPLLAMTMESSVCRRLSLLWGVIARTIDAEEFERPEEAARRLVQELQLAEEGEWILHTARFGKEQPTITAIRIPSTSE